MKWKISDCSCKYEHGPSHAENFEILIGAKPKIEHKLIFLKLFGHRRDIPANPGISRQKSLISLVSRDIPNFWPPPLHVEDPHPTRKISGPKSLCLRSSFVPELRAPNPPKPLPLPPPLNASKGVPHHPAVIRQLSKSACCEDKLLIYLRHFC